MLSLRLGGLCDATHQGSDSHDVVTDRVQTESKAVPQAIEFRDPDAAARNLARVRTRLGSEAYQSLLYILAESPDPDSAVVMLARLLDVARKELGSASGSQFGLLHYACEVFAHSNWLGETLVRNPELLQRIAVGTELGRSWSCEEFREEFARFRARSGGADLSQTMSRFRKREYVRILLRDVLRIARIGEVTEEISALSDALLQEAVTAVNSQLAHRHGAPRWVDGHGRYGESRFAVVSLGKLGGNELNYSSDVDLMFLYDGGEAPPSARFSNREYFIELAQETTDLLSRPTLEGQVFRIDLRLRPQGHEGELAVALPRAIQYYSEMAQDWELQAMIKARHSAGDVSLTREFVHAIAPLVYRPNVNFAAIKTALQTRERIDRRGRNRPYSETPGQGINVKLDRGGIRDIEFLVQCLQRVYGGEEHWLRLRGTLFALQKLHDKEHISGKDFHTLSKAYEFLRDIEHHLQLRQGQQAHRLPAGEAELRVLAKCVNRSGVTRDSAEDFVSQVRSRMAAVEEIYLRVVYLEPSNTLADVPDEGSEATDAAASGGKLYSRTGKMRTMGRTGWWAALARAGVSRYAQLNAERFLDSASTSEERYRSVMRAVESRDAALQVFESGQYLSEILIRHPEDIALLPQASGEATGFPVYGMAAESEAVSGATLGANADGLAQAKAAVRQQFRRAMFVANARGLFHPEAIWDLLRANSDIADQAVLSALRIAGSPAGLAVCALGRLGSREFDILSDADLLFVADESADLEDCRRAAERTIEVLTAYTREGAVFSVDARLRPHGAGGELVTTPTRLDAYFEREAKPWETITYLRLRTVAGNREVGERAVHSVCEGIVTAAARPEFPAGLAEMRSRLDASDAQPNFKTGPGGTYDIDFAVGRLQCEHQLIADGNLSERIHLVQRHGKMDEEHARELSANAEFLRQLEHCVRLVTGQATKWLPAGEHARHVLAKLIPSRADKGCSLEDALATALRRNREIYLQYLFD